MLELFQAWLAGFGFSEDMAYYFARGSAFLGLIIVAFVVHLVTTRFILSTITYIATRTETTWDNVILDQKVWHRLAQLIPALVIYLLTPVTLEGLDTLIALVSNVTLIYMIILLMLAVDAVFNSAAIIYQSFPASKEVPIKGFIQVLKITLYFLSAILVFAVVLNKTPVFLLSGLGALAAVLMLIFKDAILGFVAGIQLAANRMVAHGDWIEMPNYGADGDVLEVSLTTVKVQNWDKTITTIPTYALISESFKNWRGMQESGGRRIKRAINIDMESIRFCTEEMLERFAKIQYIADYIETMKHELEAFNKAAKVDNASLVNGRRMTNIGTFRAYVESYLRNHPMINLNMTFLVRQLNPTESGLPIEIYVFNKDKAWANYEAIQANIFDHILAVVAEFDLRIFQNPTGADFRGLNLQTG